MGFIRRLFGIPANRSKAAVRQNIIEKTVGESLRNCRFETMEPRRVLSANPLIVGAVYIEGDGGTDAEPDQFYISFEGGSATSNVTRIVIDGNQDGNPTMGDTDVYFDVIPENVVGNNLGVGGAHGFQWSASSSGITSGEVTATVSDGGTRLVLDLVDFTANDVLAFTIDVDQYFSSKPHDQVTSGIEFAGSSLEVSIEDSAYNFLPDPALTVGTFEYSFDFGSDGIDDTGVLSGLPSQYNRNAGNGFNSIENRTAGAREDFILEAKPVTISGYVGLSDQDGNCMDPQSAGYRGIKDVLITAVDEFGTSFTTTTDANGFYEFTGLEPGVYTVTETQPVDYLDGDDSVGTVNGSTNGSLDGNDRFINVTLGPGESAVHYNFCEHEPASIKGTVFYDENNNGTQDSGEDGIKDVRIDLLNSSGIVIDTLLTDANGDYCFENLAAGSYMVQEIQPLTYLDGIDTLGTVNGLVTGSQINDKFSQIVVRPGEQGVDYDFGEIREAIIEGVVHTDVNDNCIYEPAEGEIKLSGVRMELLDASGKVVDTKTTNQSGRYRFDGLVPGVYSVRQVQPGEYFSAGESVGIHKDTGNPGGGTASENLLTSIAVTSGEHRIDYNFCEAPAAVISGYVFQDGTAIALAEGETLSNSEAAALRDGKLTSDDTRLSGVVLELRNGITGDPISGDQALAGLYGSGPIQTTTNSDGFYEFTGLRQGNYAVFEVQPTGYIDHLDTAGTNLGIAVNPTDSIDPFVLSTLSGGVDPANDAILRIAVNWGDNAQLNNFSEIVTTTTDEPSGNPPPNPPSNPPIPQFGPKFVSPAPVRGSGGPSPVSTVGGLSAPPAAASYSWHLSIINAGSPRGDRNVDTQWNNASYLSESDWDAVDMTVGRWQISQQNISEIQQTPLTSEVIYGMVNGIPMAGDFNGDGTDELMMYTHGFWFVDINGNMQWDQEDLWAELGSQSDLPVVGDWDGDGKDDIGVYGPQWMNDLRAIDVDPGLPDLANDLATDSKNVPPYPENAATGSRKLKIHSDGKTRTDLIDHVFRYGSQQDMPVTGDWNGDGIRNIGIFRGGEWKLDADGDGRLTTNDEVRKFGREGDLPVVGDFNGDGIEQIGVFRQGTWIIDSNGNGELEITDKVFEMGSAGDIPVVGDFDGDGIDEPAVYTPPSQSGNRISKAG